MAKEIELIVDENLKRQTEAFLKNTNSKMLYQSIIDSTINNLEWLEKIEFAVPYIDNVVRNPRVALISESEIQEIEKAKKIGVDSVKHLAKHTNFIEQVDEKGVKPSKILVLLREETFNTYENRIIFTLMNDLSRFVLKKEEELKKLNARNQKELSYSSTTETGVQRVNIELKITPEDHGDGADVNESKLAKKIKDVQRRLKRLRKLITIWEKSEMISSLSKSHVPAVLPPIRKTNLILKNPNYKICTNLWLYLRKLLQDETSTDDYLVTGGNNILLKLLDDSFLESYVVLDSISDASDEQKENLNNYSIILLMHHIKRIVNILLKNGIKIKEEDLLKLIQIELGSSTNKTLIGSNDIKKKFQKEIDEYLAKVKEGL